MTLPGSRVWCQQSGIRFATPFALRGELAALLG